MLSRVADSLYWTARYLERAEHTARVLDVHLHLVLDLEPAAAQERWKRVLRTLNAGDDQTPEKLTFDAGDPCSVVSCIGVARENARQIREQISSEMFEELNRLYLYVRDPETRERFAVEPHAFFVAVKEGAHLFQGITDSTMTHGQGFRFIQVGRLMERAGAVASMAHQHLIPLLSASEPEQNYLEMLGLLKACTAWEAYCKVYSADLQVDRMADFLLLHPEFPHSVHYCVERLYRALQAIAEETGVRAARDLNKIAGGVRARLRYQRIEEVLSDSLERFLNRVRGRLAEIHEGIFSIYVADQLTEVLQ